jgi:hypothetical protein
MSAPKSRINYVVNNPIIDNITDPEGIAGRDSVKYYNYNIDQFKDRYGSTLNNNYQNPYNQVPVEEVKTNKEVDELFEDQEKFLQYSIANFKRRVNRFNPVMSSGSIGKKKY